MAFSSELEAIDAQAGGTGMPRVRLRPEDLAGLLPLHDILREPLDDTLIYCCGPAAMLDATVQTSQHWPDGSLIIERFTPKQAESESGSQRGFDVEAVRSRTTVHVTPDVSIVEALESAGITVDTSCLEGICGTCETKVLGGTPEHRDSLLSEAEQKANQTMMICVSRARGSKLVLDI